MARILVLAGGVDPYVDPWHPYAETARRVAIVGLDRGHRVEVVDDVAGRIAEGLDDVDVLVALAPDAPTLPPRDRERAWLRLEEWTRQPCGVLGLHVGLTTLLGWPRWSALMGARWVPGVSGHPPHGRAGVRTLPHRLTTGVGAFELVDELYSGLEITGDAAVAVDHEIDGVAHPLVWTRREGGTRIVADALGHDPASFDASEHVAVLARALDWLGAAVASPLVPELTKPDNRNKE
jgi:type 1 glutamine amidotransferase